MVVAACNPERLKNQDSWTAFRFFQFFMREGTPLYRTRDLRAQTQSASKDLRLLWFHLRRSFSELQPTENSNSPKFIQAIWSEVAAISRGESPWRHGEMTANTPNSHCPSWFACLVVAHVLTRGASYNTCHLLPAKFDNSFENYITLIELQLLACAFKASSFAEFDETLEVIFSNWLVLLLAGKTPDVNVSDLRAKLFKRMDKKPGKQRVKWPLCFLLKRLALAEPTQGWSILLTAVKWDVDHICPQSIHAGTDFATWWPSLAEREEWLHRLGNLTLLPPSANRAKQNGRYVFFLFITTTFPPPNKTLLVMRQTWRCYVMDHRDSLRSFKEMISLTSLCYGHVTSALWQQHTSCGTNQQQLS